MKYLSRIESLLFITVRPLTPKKIAELIDGTVSEVEAVIDHLIETYNKSDRGINIIRHGGQVQMVTSPDNSRVVRDFLKAEQAGELTRPALETLTIIAYRGPISKIQLDTIRGVNCALILRNLMIKGLIESRTAKNKLNTTYQVSMDFIRFLGLHQVSDLPNYQKLNQDENLEHLLNPTLVEVKSEPNSTSEINPK